MLLLIIFGKRVARSYVKQAMRSGADGGAMLSF
jgi:hypothetical protein